MESDYNKAKEAALRKLQAKSWHSSELKKALKLKAFSDDAIDQAVADCKRWGYLNDSEWISGFIEGQLQKNKSMQAVAFKLRAKGIPREEYEGYLAKAKGENDPKEAIRTILKTKYKKLNLSDYRDKQKAIGALLRKGFQLEDILTSIDN